MTTTPILRVEQDVGLLTNVRMGVEIAVGLAHLTGRRLSMPFDQRVPGAPVSSIAKENSGSAAGVLDLLELPIEVVDPQEWSDVAQAPCETLEWEAIGDIVLMCDQVDSLDPQLIDFANGRTRFEHIPHTDAQVLRIDGRLLAFYSYCFFGAPHQLRQLHGVLQGVRARRPYGELGSKIAAGLHGRFNAVHLRRSDLTIGIPAYGGVSSEVIAANVAKILPTSELLVVCSEVDERDSLFDPLRRRFPEVVFATTLILDDHREAFFSLPRHEDNALGLITQEVACRSSRFVGTVGSTFTAMIQRMQLLREPGTRFRYTADYTPSGPLFVDGEYLDRREGTYSWNRIGFDLPPGTLAWFRDWPEAI